MQIFTTQSLLTIIKILKQELESLQSQDVLSFEVFNPDLCHGIYSGNIQTTKHGKYIYRSYKTWF